VAVLNEIDAADVGRTPTGQNEFGRMFSGGIAPAGLVRCPATAPDWLPPFEFRGRTSADADTCRSEFDGAVGRSAQEPAFRP